MLIVWASNESTRGAGAFEAQCAKGQDLVCGAELCHHWRGVVRRTGKSPPIDRRVLYCLMLTVNLGMAVK